MIVFLFDKDNLNTLYKVFYQKDMFYTERKTREYYIKEKKYLVEILYKRIKIDWLTYEEKICKIPNELVYYLENKYPYSSNIWNDRDLTGIDITNLFDSFNHVNMTKYLIENFSSNRKIKINSIFS